LPELYLTSPLTCDQFVTGRGGKTAGVKGHAN
jgi:hypothetical protein